jgi:threonine aldolase
VKTIDLRSDTTTRPTAAMREAMANAAVGDDGFQEDPTVIELERKSAELLGKEAGLYMTSGTQSNLVAALEFTGPNERLVGLKNNHLAYTLHGDPRIAPLTKPLFLQDRGRGLADPDELRAAIDGPGEKITMLALENSFNTAGGTALHPSETAPHVAIARERGMSIHLDGARLFNAAAALGLPASELAAIADSVTFCLSKGLGAPVGSMLCGSHEFIKKARIHRQYLGGTMRQAGIIAAAGIVALDTMIDRLPEDHANAAFLAEGFAQLPGIVLPFPVETNLVFIDVAATGMTAQEVVARLEPSGVRLGAFYNDRLIRIVTHYEISREDCEIAIAELGKVLESANMVA